MEHMQDRAHRPRAEPWRAIQQVKVESGSIEPCSHFFARSRVSSLWFCSLPLTLVHFLYLVAHHLPPCQWRSANIVRMVDVLRLLCNVSLGWFAYSVRVYFNHCSMVPAAHGQNLCLVVSPILVCSSSSLSGMLFSVSSGKKPHFSSLSCGEKVIALCVMFSCMLHWDSHKLSPFPQ